MGLTTLACLFASLIAPRVASAAPALGGSGIATGVDTTTETSTPITNVYDWAVGGATRDLIHPSCNATERLQLERALNDTMKLAQHAKEHILRFGNSSHFYVRYFGDAPSAEPIGWFERVVNADRSGMTFRCDDPDDNCRLPGTCPCLVIFPASDAATNDMSIRLGWPLAWRERNSGDCDL